MHPVTVEGLRPLSLGRGHRLTRVHAPGTGPRMRVLLGRTVPRVASLRPWAWRLLEVALGTAAQTGPEQATGSRPEKRKCALILGVDGHGLGLSSGPAPRVLRPLPLLRSPAPSVHVLLTNGEDGLGWPQPQGRPGGPGGRPARTCPVPWPGRWPSGARGPKAWRAVEPPRAPAPRLCPHVPPRLGRDVRNQPLHVSQPWQIQTPLAS